MRLTWKREPRETGLASITQGERGYDLNLGGERIGGAYPSYNGWNRHDVVGWMWVAGDEKHGIEHRSSHLTPVATMEEAKERCIAYVRAQLAQTPAAKEGS